ncbi:MAG: hypothetical protein HC829_03070 [Bacteroidales bacterium]|nr:hypothetical protein [Bacteroidales bacterium]
MRRCVFVVAASSLVVAPAFAADLARRAPTPHDGAPVPAIDWTGVCLGSQIGLNYRFAPVPPVGRTY